MVQYALWCFIENTDLHYDVSISKDEYVSHLKNMIHDACNNDVWNGVKAQQLVLLKVCDSRMTRCRSNYTLNDFF
jgi:hypothetical protein